MGIGSSDLFGSIEKGKLASEFGAKGVLLPIPHFFRYEQDDVQVFFEEVAKHISSNIILYNLPQFTGGFEAKTTLNLIQQTPNIVGIKESSGSLETFNQLYEKRDEGLGNARIVRNIFEKCVMNQATRVVKYHSSVLDYTTLQNIGEIDVPSPEETVKQVFMTAKEKLVES